MKISFYNSISAQTPSSETTIDNFLRNVKEGMWKEKIEPIRLLTDKKERQEAKKNLPALTVSASFEGRRIKGAPFKHSGFICIDVDEVISSEDENNASEYWNKIIKDKYTYGAFRSVSGTGFAIAVKVNPKKHLESFLSLESYYLETYGIKIDKACKDIPRPRYVSYDPETFVNQEAETFDKFVKIKKAPKKVNYNFNNVVIGSNDIEHIIKQAQERSVDLCSEYDEWIKIGFSLAAEFGEGGRGYFHALSSIGANYDPQKCDKQYDNCVKSDGSGVTIATLFHYAKENNIEIQTKRTKEIALAVNIRKGGRDSSLENVKKLITETFEDVDEEDLKVAEKAFNSNFDIKKDKDTTIEEKLLQYLKHNHNIKFNEMTNSYEEDGAKMQDKRYNTIAANASIFLGKSISPDIVYRLVDTDFTESYHPVKTFIENNRHKRPTGEIKKLCNTIIGDHENIKEWEKYRDFFVKKWLVGLIQTVYERHSPLVLILLGPQRTGKTSFFRKILPEKLREYHVDTKMKDDKDYNLLLCEKLLVNNDEWGGKTKSEAEAFKALTSAESFSIRKAYGRMNQDYKRLAVLGGTTNNDKVLNDSTGNRRIIPLKIKTILENEIKDVKKDDLFIELFHLYNEGANTDLSPEDIDFLNSFDKDFQEETVLAGYIAKYFYLPEEMETYSACIKMHPVDVIQHINEQAHLNMKHSVRVINGEMKTLGFDQKKINHNGRWFRGYELIPRDQSDIDKKGTYNGDSKMYAF